MKAGKAHLVPLSLAAASILLHLPRLPNTDILFAGQSTGGRLSEDTLNEVIERMHAREVVASDAEGRPVVAHGMRSTFRNWGREMTNFQPELLELSLAHAGIGRVPSPHVAVEIAIVAAVSVEQQGESSPPVGWDHAVLRVARAFGDAWIRERRTAVLLAPPVVARRAENVLLNLRHADFRMIVAASPEPVVWAARLFSRH